jgi:hypothetical protein
MFVISGVSAYHLGSKRWDQGLTTKSSAEGFLMTLHEVLGYPLFHYLGKSIGAVFSGLFGYIPVFINAMVWSVPVWVVFLLISNSRRTKKSG